MAVIKQQKVCKPEFKAKVALEAVKDSLTINQIDKRFEVHRASDFQMEETISRNLAADF